MNGGCPGTRGWEKERCWSEDINFQLKISSVDLMYTMITMVNSTMLYLLRGWLLIVPTEKEKERKKERGREGGKEGRKGKKVVIRYGDGYVN